jgi:AcrR family transcriptional regulator
MDRISVQDVKAAAVRERVLEGVREVLERGEAITFTRVANAAGIPERTVYRYFPTREALLAAMFDWANKKIGFGGELPADEVAAQALVRKAFPGFDSIAPVVRELLAAPEGRAARLSDKARRRVAAIALVRHEAPHLDKSTTRQVAAVVQLLTTASAWQTLCDYFDMDGEEAAEASALAIHLVLNGARTRAKKIS